MHLSNLQSMASRVGSASLPNPTANIPRACNDTTSQNSFYHSQQHQDAHSSNVDKSDSDSDNYKMVIKNGVLMKKQKQRRYRTERPHECEHCNARFTLRSNMERHIKQQHGGEPSVTSNSSSIPSLVRHDPQLKEDEDRDENEDSDCEPHSCDDRRTHSSDNGIEGKMSVSNNKDHINEIEEEEEEEGVDLSCLEKLVKGTKPFNTFFDNSEDEDEESGRDDVGMEEKKMSAYSTALLRQDISLAIFIEASYFDAHWG